MIYIMDESSGRVVGGCGLRAMIDRQRYTGGAEPSAVAVARKAGYGIIMIMIMMRDGIDTWSR